MKRTSLFKYKKLKGKVNCGKFHRCMISVKGFREGKIFATLLRASNPKNTHPE